MINGVSKGISKVSMQADIAKQGCSTFAWNTLGHFHDTDIGLVSSSCFERIDELLVHVDIGIGHVALPLSLLNGQGCLG